MSTSDEALSLVTSLETICHLYRCGAIPPSNVKTAVLNLLSSSSSDSASAPPLPPPPSSAPSSSPSEDASSGDKPLWEREASKIVHGKGNNNKASGALARATSVDQIQALSALHVPAYVQKYWGYTAGEGVTAKQLIPQAFANIRLVPRALLDEKSLVQNELSTELSLSFVLPSPQGSEEKGKGQEGNNSPATKRIETLQFSSPIFIGATGFHRLADERGEIAAAEASKRAGTCYVYNFMFSNISAEEVAAVGGTQWMSIYILKERDFVRYAISKAEELGFKAIVITCDHPTDRVKDTTLPMFDSEGDHEWLNKVMKFSNIENFRRINGLEQSDSVGENDALVTWDDIRWVRNQTSLPILCKGILSPSDAVKAVNAGANGIIVSNHGGRQMDCTPPSIEVLPSIVKVLKGSHVPVLIDSGFRTGTQVLKALALGASAVLLGRPILWGLGAGGEEGVVKVLDLMKRELKYDMECCGCSSLAAINRSIIAE